MRTVPPALRAAPYKGAQGMLWLCTTLRQFLELYLCQFLELHLRQFLELHLRQFLELHLFPLDRGMSRQRQGVMIRTILQLRTIKKYTIMRYFCDREPSLSHSEPAFQSFDFITSNNPSFIVTPAISSENSLLTPQVVPNSNVASFSG